MNKILKALLYSTALIALVLLSSLLCSLFPKTMTVILLIGGCGFMGWSLASET